ncbi:MAG: hypothetical protein GY696_07020 [Gammaproteobacteria bacterium]|nr:hypothetical protein [Gammaproteobacteria bacterium]
MTNLSTTSSDDGRSPKAECNPPVLNDPKVWREDFVSFDDVEKVLVFKTQNVPASKIGRIRPSGKIAFTAKFASYIIDLNALRSPKDIRSDSLGAYMALSRTSRYYGTKAKADGSSQMERFDKKPNKPNKEPPSWDLQLTCIAPQIGCKCQKYSYIAPSGNSLVYSPLEYSPPRI